MRICWTAKLCSWWLALFLTVPACAQAEPASTHAVHSPASIVHLQSQQNHNPQTALQAFSRANVVYLGETHDSPEDHQAQLAIIQTLYKLHPDMVIAMEMFQRPYQPVLDRYLAGILTEAQLREQSEYETRWVYPWEFYAPILRFAKQNRLAVVALNTPTEITRKVARQGLDSLTFSDRRFVPPRSAIVLEPDLYRQRMQEFYQGFHHRKSSSGSFERFFQAQVLWDETMAERIAQILRRQPNTLVVVLVGQGHLLYGDGIPSRVARRINQIRSRSTPLTQVSVLLNPPDSLKSEKNTASGGDRLIADYFYYSCEPDGSRCGSK